MNNEFEHLYKIANGLAVERELNSQTYVGKVAVALLTDKNHLYTGLSLKVTCSLGFCAEQAAISEMLSNNETRIVKIIAVYQGGEIISPCGKCRELIYQINHENLDCEVQLNNKILTLKELLPEL